jgi:hypothetical protein
MFRECFQKNSSFAQGVRRSVFAFLDWFAWCEVIVFKHCSSRATHSTSTMRDTAQLRASVLMADRDCRQCVGYVAELRLYLALACALYTDLQHQVHLVSVYCLPRALPITKLQ